MSTMFDPWNQIREIAGITREANAEVRHIEMLCRELRDTVWLSCRTCSYFDRQMANLIELCRHVDDLYSKIAQLDKMTSTQYAKIAAAGEEIIGYQK